MITEIVVWIVDHGWPIIIGLVVFWFLWFVVLDMSRITDEFERDQRKLDWLIEVDRRYNPRELAEVSRVGSNRWKGICEAYNSPGLMCIPRIMDQTESGGLKFFAGDWCNSCACKVMSPAAEKEDRRPWSGFDLDFYDPAKIVTLPPDVNLEVIPPVEPEEMPADRVLCGYCNTPGVTPGSCSQCGAPLPLTDRQTAYLNALWYAPRYKITGGRNG